MLLRVLNTIALLSWVAAAQPQTGPASHKPDFATEIAPIFKTHCYACHGSRTQMSGLRLDDGTAALKGGNSGAVILAGRSAESPLVLRISGAPGITAMPPAGPRLTPEQIGLIRAWIDQGAVWPGVDATR